MRKSNLILIALLIGGMTAPVLPARSDSADTGAVYLPAVLNAYNAATAVSGRTVNIPFLDVAEIATSNKFPEMSVFWFGKVTPHDNYTDVRVAYNSTQLEIYSATLDRLLWYDASAPQTNDLENWDSVSVFLDLGGGQAGGLPGTQSYRFVAALHHWQTHPQYQAQYRGNGSGWAAQPLGFTIFPGWSGTGGLNTNNENKGWAMTFSIPFASLGLSGPPAEGTTWRLGMAVHDRDTLAGPARTPQFWPEDLDGQTPNSWGLLRFGLPVFTPPAPHNPQTTTIRQGLNGASVPDVSAGGGVDCGGTMDYWTQWGEKNYAGAGEINIQNQALIADWPCFSKMYVTFPLDGIPGGAVIRSARLELRHFGGSDPSQAYRSLIQVFSVGDDWSEASLNWNNAPLAVENVSRGWVPVTDYPGNWGIVRIWDVSGEVARAYSRGQPVRLALYSGDGPMHSGKHFRSSDVDDFGAEARPTLVVEWDMP